MNRHRTSISWHQWSWPGILLPALSVVVCINALDFSGGAPILDIILKPPSVTDQELFEGISRKDNRAFQHLYDEYHVRIQAMVRQNNGNDDDAMDIFQEGLVALWTNIQTGRFQVQESARISTYLYALCRNIWISRLRKKRDLSVLDDHTEVADTDQADDQIETYEQTQAIRGLLQQLSDSCRQLLDLFYYRQSSLAVIAEQLGITEKTAKNNKYRCMQRLRMLSKDANL